MIITWAEFWICCALVAGIGGGGFSLGCMLGTDRADQRHADELARHLALRAARRIPLAEQTYRPPLVAAVTEQDTMPMRVVPALTAALSRAAAGLAGHATRQEIASPLEAATSPASLELAISLAAHRTELEIDELIQHAEWKIGALGPEWWEQ